MQTLIEQAFEQRTEFTPTKAPSEVKNAVEHILCELDEGRLRVAEKIDGVWKTHTWVKQAILLSFRLWENQIVDAGFTRFYDKLPLKYSHTNSEAFQKQNVRVVPHAIVRRGAFIAPHSILMPSYVNIGAYVGKTA